MGESMTGDSPTELLVAAGEHPQALADAVRHNPQACVDDLVAELCSRALAHAPATVHLVVHTGTGSADNGIHCDPLGTTSTPGAPYDPLVRIEIGIEELARLLFGSPEESLAAHWRHVLTYERPASGSAESRHQSVALRKAAAAATHALVGEARRRPGLDELAVRFGSDKWGGLHWYTPHYETHLRRFRGSPVKVLEIGIGGYDDPWSGGESLRMWQRYFPRGRIYGLDVHQKRIALPRVEVIRGDQSDQECLADIVRRHGPFDIVIDDGSHVVDHVRTSFWSLYPSLRPHGVYVVEDLQTSYWPSYGGDASDPRSTTTSMGLLKQLVDGLNHQERSRSDDDQVTYLDRNVVAVHFYHNLAFVIKGTNDEAGPVQLPGART